MSNTCFNYKIVKSAILFFSVNKVMSCIVSKRGKEIGEREGEGEGEKKKGKIANFTRKSTQFSFFI